MPHTSVATATNPGTELEQALASFDTVIVCWESGCTMHRLPHWREGQWVSRRQAEGYPRYSHGICTAHLGEYQREIDAILGEEDPGAQQSLEQVAVCGT